MGHRSTSGGRRVRWSMRWSLGSVSCCGRFRGCRRPVIAERIGWKHSIRTLSGRIAQLRPLFLPPDPASRTTYEAGEIGQCDFWFPDVEVPVGFGQVRTAKLLPVLTMVCGYSRWASGMLIPSRAAEDLYAGWWQHLSTLGGTPKVLVWDGEGAVGRWRALQPELTEHCQTFRGTLAAKVLICKPADPEAKGLVERLHDYLERSFLPGRTFTSPTDFNTQLQTWLVTANHRQHRALGCRPVDRFPADKAAMLTLPPVAPTVGWQSSSRLPRDHYVRLDSNDYSVHPAAVGRRIQITADLTRIKVWCDQRLVADHDRVWAKHQTVSDPQHVQAAKALRRRRFDLPKPAREVEVEQRRLTDYDTFLGVDGPVA